MLLCNQCSNKILTDGKDLDSLTQVPTAPVPKRGTGVGKEVIEQKKKFKCPKCGYILHIVKLGTPQEIKEELRHPDKDDALAKLEKEFEKKIK